MLNVKNTAKDWHEYLVSLADEAQRDAQATSEDLALHGVLKDLSLVAAAYAGRLNVERGSGGEQLKQPAPVDDAQLVTDASIAASQAGPVSPSAPSWLLETADHLTQRIEALEARVAELELNQRKIEIAPAPSFLSGDATVWDEDRSQWNSVDRARAALRGMIAREHQQRARTRQTILARVTHLSTQPGELSPDEKAELYQHRERANELGEIDAIAGVKLDEIAGIDDLMELREFDVKKGWPE